MHKFFSFLLALLLTTAPTLAQQSGGPWSSAMIGGKVYDSTHVGGSTKSVVGPSSATDGHCAVFDGTTGALLKDAGACSGGGSITFTDGTHTVTGATQLTVTGGTVGGSTPNATLTVTGGGGSGASQFTGFSGAMLQASSGQSITNSTSTALTWASATYDVGSWSNIGSHPTRLTVPTGVTRARVTCGTAWASSPTFTIVAIGKNGADPIASASYNGLSTMSTSGGLVSVVSPILQVSPTDYFECYVFQGSGGTINTTGDGYQYFGIQAEGAPITAPFLEQRVASNSATLDFTTGITDACQVYDLVLDRLVAQTSDDALLVQLGTGGGPTWVTSGYTYTYQTPDTSSTTVPPLINSTSDASLTGNANIMGIWHTAAKATTLTLRFSGLRDATANKQAGLMSYAGYGQSGGSAYQYISGTGNLPSTTVVTGIRVKLGTQNIASGVGTLNCVVQ